MNQVKTPIELAQIAGIMQAAPQVLRSMLKAVSEEVLRWHPGPEAWCINEVIGHLIEADTHAFIARLNSMLADSRPDIQGWDANAAAAGRRDCEKNTFELLDELAANREGYAQFITELQPEQLTRTGIYGHYGEFTVADFVYEWAYHDHSHLMQISGNIRAYIWPNFTESMKTALSQ